MSRIQRIPYRPHLQPRRSQIRAYFAAPLLIAKPKPVPPLNLGWWGRSRWFIWPLLVLMTVLTGYALYRGELGQTIIRGLFAAVLFGIGLYVGDRIAFIREGHDFQERTYNVNWSAYKADLNKWGVTEIDLENPATLAEADERLQEDLSWIREHRALKRLGLVKEHLINWPPILLVGPLPEPTGRSQNRPSFLPALKPDYTTVFQEWEAQSARRDVSGVIRFPWYDIMVLCPTNTHVAVYEAEYNFLRGPDEFHDQPDSIITRSLINERTYEFLYQDIISISTDSGLLHHEVIIRRDIPPNTIPTASIEETHHFLKSFKISVLGDQAVSVGIALGDIDDRNLPQPLRLDFERHLQFIRTMVREKKGG